MHPVIRNGSARYVVIAVDAANQPRRMLLRRLGDNEHVIAEGVVWDSEHECYWSQGCYFGSNLKSATKEFFGDDGIE